ncbi:MAG: hypothetical protein VYB37_05130 [Pseudomonadota bacterium]|nr:hypothetical protein [Pseudomonadota bacterium]
MSLLGTAAMVFWHDVDSSDDDYKDWHSNEHMTERVSVPGFLRGRRARAVMGHPQYFIMYEVDAIGVLTSKAYLDRLNDPSPWTRKVLARYRDSNRTLCRLEQSWGLGTGTLLTTCRMVPAEDRADQLRDWVENIFLENCVSKGSIVGAHFLTVDEVASHAETKEKKLRDRPDEVASWVLIVEGYDEDSMRSIVDRALQPEQLEVTGAASSYTAIYQLEHIASDADIRCARPGRVNGPKRE